MTKADNIFIDCCNEILQNGVHDTGEIRAKWDDGTPAHAKHIFGVTNRYDLGNGCEFPIMTLRRTSFISAIDEILWIWQKKSNNVNDLASHIWDAWADEKGSIGKAYGYQLSEEYSYKSAPIIMDQVDKLLFDLRTNHTSRRMIVTMWNVADLKDMALEPCAYSMTFNVTGNKLNAVLNQRSQDMLTASNWNVVQYAVLLMLIAKVSGFETGTLLHVIADCHIYDRHEVLVEKLITNRNNFRAPIIGTDAVIKPEVRSFYDFEPKDFLLGNYMFNEFNEKIPVAI